MYEELITALRNCANADDYCSQCDRYEDGLWCGDKLMEQAADAIKELLTLKALADAKIDRLERMEDAVPVKHGEWIRCGDGENVPYQCSHCGKTVPAILVEKWAGVKYCPMCGAKVEANNG